MTVRPQHKDDFKFVAKRLESDGDKARCEKTLGNLSRAKSKATTP